MSNLNISGGTNHQVQFQLTIKDTGWKYIYEFIQVYSFSFNLFKLGAELKDIGGEPDQGNFHPLVNTRRMNTMLK